jgi:O-antigen/teichoic acid export membrane protein
MPFVKKLINDRFFKNNLIFFVGTFIVSVLNYAFHPILGRMMGAADYGEVQTLIALVAQVAVFQGMFGIVIINIVANGGDEQEKQSVISEIRKVALYSAAGLFAALLILSMFFKNFLQFNSVWPFLGVAAMIPLSVAITVRNSFLQGKQRFKDVSINGILQAGGKLLFAVVLVFAGWRAFGAIVGILLAQGVGFCYLYNKTKGQVSFVPFRKTKLTKKISKELIYGIVVLIATSATTFLYCGDVVVIKHFFSPQEAGLYSGVSVVARIIYFLVGPIISVLFASVAINKTQKENTILFLKSLAIVAVVGGGIAVIFALAPAFVINLLVGQEYLVYAWLLPKLSLLLFIASAVSLFFMYYLALRKYFVALAALGGVAAITILSYFWHADLAAVVWNFILGGSAILAILIISFVYNQAAWLTHYVRR